MSVTQATVSFLKRERFSSRALGTLSGAATPSSPTDPGQLKDELTKIQEVAQLGAEKGLQVYAGHGLRTDNVGPIAGIPQISELNIGHAIVSRSVMVGIEAAVKEMLAAMNGG